ncbi:MAG TPA: Bax inhibitor-1 family protein [Acidimicrobiales bacterium]|nr:Bax inhibitor-1 family protein [Acidimicrobiales bacterium]
MSAAPVGYRPVATLDEIARGEFVTRVYQHLLAAVVAFVAFEALLINLGAAGAIYDLVAGSSSAWLLVLGGFMVVNWMATTAAHDVLNPSRQYLGLFGLAAAEALIFAPFLHYFFEVQPDGTTTVMAAALITAAGFAGLTAIGFVTRADLSFLRPMLLWAGVCALVLIGAALLFGLELGVWFSVAMIALAGASILYQTQAILRRYPSEAYVGASVQLFASVMMLFWYVLRLLGALRR